MHYLDRRKKVEKRGKAQTEKGKGLVVYSHGRKSWFTINDDISTVVRVTVSAIWSLQ